MTTSLLERRMYTEAAAADLLAIPQNTLHYWLEGGGKGGRVYAPVIRAEPLGYRAPVTWAEFIEAGLLRQYRDSSVPMRELRNFIDGLRQSMGVPYPLAHFQPFADGGRLMRKVQAESGLQAAFALVAEVSGQFVLMPAAQQFVDRVTWEDDIATRWRPDENKESEVVIDPDLRGGRPSVGGISTRALWEQSEGGETEDDLAETYQVTLAQVRWALAYEMVPRAA